MRKRMHKKLDKRIFRRTESTTKKINIKPVVMRGGIRL